MKKRKEQLLGINLLRCVAIFAVVILHSDEGITILPNSWKNITQFSLFAVPFFLATSFYLACKKITESGQLYPLKPRLTRLLIPYFFWTFFYIGYKALKALVDNNPHKLETYLSDPIHLLLFGGSAFHLYFLPLLLAGILLINPLALWFKSIRHKDNILIYYLVILFLSISLIAYSLMINSGNDFQIESGVAFENLLNSLFIPWQNHPIIRIIAVGISWIVRCIPYLILSMYLCLLKIEKPLEKSNLFTIIALGSIFFVVAVFGHLFLPKALGEMGRGFLPLLLAIAMSGYLTKNIFLDSLSQCSFGIYLVHMFFVELLQSIEKKFFGVHSFRHSTINLLWFSLAVMILSWIVVAILQRRKFLAKFMFGS